MLARYAATLCDSLLSDPAASIKKGMGISAAKGLV